MAKHQTQTRVGMSEFEGSEPASDGWHRFVVAEVVDLGEEASKFKAGEMQHRGFLLCQIDEVYEGEGDLAGTRKEVRQYFDYNIGFGGSKKGSKLRTMVEQWRGRPFTEAELDKIRAKGFDLAKFVGFGGLVMTVSEKAKTSENMFAKPVKWAPTDDKAAVKAGAEEGAIEVEGFKPYWDREAKVETAAGAPRGGGGTPFDDPADGDGSGDTGGTPFDDF
jgi:hypothetical protein